MFKGYLSLGGTELANAARTEAYVTNNAPSIPLRNCIGCGDIATVLGDGVYDSPLVDDAPWFDPNTPATNRFYGLYPLSIEGIEDSTRTADVTQSIADGGSVGATRFATRSVRVTGLLLAADELAMSSGMTWLRNALDPAPCATHGGSCGGAQLCYYATCPDLCVIFPNEPYAPSFTVPFFQESVNTSPSIFRNTIAEDMWKSRIAIDDADKEGLIIQWGAVSQDNTTETIEAHGPVVVKRTNYVRNPTFRLGLSYWSFVGGTATIITDTEGIPYGEGNYGEGEYGGGGEVLPNPYLQRTGGTPGVPVTLRTDDMLAYAGGTIASFNLWHPEDESAPTVTVNLRAVLDNSVLATANFTVDKVPRRYSFASNFGGDVYLEFVTSGIVNIDQVMFEAGFTPLPYFDGNTPAHIAMAGYFTNEITPEYTVAWAGIVDGSVSQIAWLGSVTTGASMLTWDESREGVCNAYPMLNIIQGTASGTIEIATRAPVSMEDQVSPIERTMHDVTCVEGPTIITERVTSSGAVIREVEFLLVAGRPAPYGPTTDALPPTIMADLPTSQWVDVDCTVPEPVAIIDPDCPPVPSPPRPPSIPNACVTEETTWQRYWLRIDQQFVSSWSQTAPQVTITSGAEEIRQVRVRAYPNPFHRPVEVASRRNLAFNGAMRATDTGITPTNDGSATTGRVTGIATPIPGVDTAFRTSFTSAATIVEHAIALPGQLLVTPGKNYTFSAYVQGTKTGSTVAFLYYLDSGGSVIGTFSSAGEGVLPNTWIRRDVSGVAPVGAVRARVMIRYEGAFVSTDTVTSTGFLLENTGSVKDFFDGATPSTFGWYYGWSDGVGSEGIASTSPVDPCSFCSEFIVSYLPSNTTLTVDSILERAFASVAGGEPASANHLLYSGDGGPMTWPELTCGMEYLIAIDVPEPLLDDVTVSVTLTMKE